MLKRKIEQKIVNWLNNYDTSLLIEGARQVGKSTIIRKVLNDQKADFVEFNLLENMEFVKMLSDIDKISTEEFIAKLKLFSSKKLTPNQTIIFIDEIQECPKLITKVKFLVEEGSFRYIFSGSLLGIELKNVKSMPVGYMFMMKMHPMDFEEFLWSQGVDQSTVDLLKKSYENLTPVNPSIHEKILTYFRKYLIVGGMPQAVQNFVDYNDYNEVINIHNYIINSYKADFTKYENNSKKLLLMRAYDNIPSELNSQNKRYVIKNLDDAKHYKRLELTFEWHNAAGVTIPVYNCTEPIYPLKLNKKVNLFKLFLNDVGLLTTMFGKTTIKSILNNNTKINYGALFENFVAQELNSHGYDCYYYNSRKYGELDFVIETDQALPIEVKSGKNYTKHYALDNVMSNAAYNIEKAYVLSNENVSFADIATIKTDVKDFEIKDKYRIVYLPIYMTMFIDEDKINLNKK